MDHGGQFGRDSRVMSQLPLGRVVDLCDNLHRPEALTAQTRNLNETNTLTQTPDLSTSQNEEEQDHRIIQNAPLNNNGNGKAEEMGKEGYAGRGTEEEDIDDEVMKEAEEEGEEESEESSVLIHCQSPDTPMTDSSYSETGSLSETPCPFSPGTSPEPTSPVIPVVGPGTLYCVGPVEPSQRDTDVDSSISNTESVASITAEHFSATLTPDTRPTSPPGPVCVTGGADGTAENTNFTAGMLTSSTGSATAHADHHDSSRLSGSTTGALVFSTGLTTTGTESTSTTGPVTSDWDHVTSTCVSGSSRTTGTNQCASPLEGLELLAHKGDDTHFPQYLHQIAETFVLHDDYRRALWCIQLERLYHQRVLDNLKALQDQWESKCATSSGLDVQHLDSLKHICLTHSRPGPGDAEGSSVDILRPAFEEGGAQPVGTSAHHIDGGMEQRTEDPSYSQSSHPVTPSIKLTDRVESSENSKKHREDPNRELPERDCIHGSQLTDEEHSSSERGGAEGDIGYTTTLIGNGLHPPTAGIMDQSKPAEQQGGDLGLTHEREAKVQEEEDLEVAVEALEMKDEEEKEKQKEIVSDSSQTLVSGAEVGAQQLHQEAPAESSLHQESGETRLHQEDQSSQEAPVKQPELGEDEEEEDGEEEEEEEEEYEEGQADIIREAASLDDMAKLITVEEISPASGLVSILKKRSVCVGTVSASAGLDPQPEKLAAKRRVRFKVPDDGYEQDVGGGDSCLLLFLLCLVTVVISVGGTALYCALGDAHSSVCQDFSRNADFYIGQIQRGITQIHRWLTPGS